MGHSEVYSQENDDSSSVYTFREEKDSESVVMGEESILKELTEIQTWVASLHKSGEKVPNELLEKLNNLTSQLKEANGNDKGPLEVAFEESRVENHPHSTPKSKVSKYIKSLFPPLTWFPVYLTKWKTNIRGDLIAGATVGVMLIPQGMAYALVAGMPPIYGLYSSIVPIFLYAIFGTSHELGNGPVAMVSLLLSSGISSIAEEGSDEYIQLAFLLSFLVGVVQLFLGFLRLGFLANFLSHPVMSVLKELRTLIFSGFTSAAAFIIGGSQLRHLFGTSPTSSSQFVITLYNIFKTLPNTRWRTFLIGINAIILLMKVKQKWLKWGVYIPGPLIAVAIGILFAFFLNLESYGVALVGNIPSGLPPPSNPFSRVEKIVSLIGPTVSISLIGFMESISIAKKMAEKKHYKIYPSQELIALGFSNLGAAFFSGFPVTGSFSRSAVNEQSGASSTLASVVSAFITLLSTLFLTGILYYLPMAILAAIILVAVSGLVDFQEAIHLWRVKKIDCVQWVVAFLATLILGIENGIITAVAASLITVISKSAHPHVAQLGRLGGTHTYRNVDRFPQAYVIPGVAVLRFDAPLYFANVEFFKKKIATLEKGQPQDRALLVLVLDFSSISDIDWAACEELKELILKFRKRNILVLITSLNGPVRDTLRRAKLIDVIHPDNIFWEVHTAMERAQAYVEHRNGEEDSGEDVRVHWNSKHLFDFAETKTESKWHFFQKGPK